MLIKTDVKRARHVRLKSVASVKRNERDQHRPTRATSHKILSFVRSVVAFQSQAKDEKAQHTNNNNNDNYNDNDNGNGNECIIFAVKAFEKYLSNVKDEHRPKNWETRSFKM